MGTHFNVLIMRLIGIIITVVVAVIFYIKMVLRLDGVWAFYSYFKLDLYLEIAFPALCISHECFLEWLLGIVCFVNFQEIESARANELFKKQVASSYKNHSRFLIFVL